MRGRGGITAGELLSQLATDPEYQAMRLARDQDLARIADERMREQQSLLNDLAAAGTVVDWVGRLLEIPTPDERIYPVLFEHITKPYTPWLLEWIGRAFGRKSARFVVWERLLGLIKSYTLPDGAVEGVMASISEMARPQDLPTIIDLLSNRSLGRHRVYLVINLMRSKRKEARDALIKNQDDPDLNIEIIARLSRKRN
jgi:hypothetical protein